MSDPNDGFQYHQDKFYTDCGLSTISNPNQNLTDACIMLDPPV